MKLKKQQLIDVQVKADYPPGFELDFSGYVRHAKKGDDIIIDASGAVTLYDPYGTGVELRKSMSVFLESLAHNTVDVTTLSDTHPKTQYVNTDVRVLIRHPNGTTFVMEFTLFIKKKRTQSNSERQVTSNIRAMLSYTGPIEFK